MHYRDRFREARYAALADAEGFEAICFALEALGLRLLLESKQPWSAIDLALQPVRSSHRC